MKLTIEDLDFDEFDHGIDYYMNMYLSNINNVITIEINGNRVTLSNFAKIIYDTLKTEKIYQINNLDGEERRMERKQLEIKRIDGARAFSSSQITPDFIAPTTFITEIDYILPDGIIPALEKEIVLSGRSSIDDASAYADFLYEIILQEYAYQLANRLTRVKIPKIFWVKKDEARVSFCMERLERIPKSSIYKFYKTWDPIIHKVFEYFAENHLYHLDTAYRNMYITSFDGYKKLAIIDFGEARIYETHDDEIYTTSQKTGYPIRKVSNTIKRKGVKSWMYPGEKDYIFDLENKLSLNESKVLKRARIFSYGGRTKKYGNPKKYSRSKRPLKYSL